MNQRTQNTMSVGRFWAILALTVSLAWAPASHAQTVEIPAAALVALANNDTSLLEAFVLANPGAIAALGTAAVNNPGLATMIAYAASRALPPSQAPAIAASITSAIRSSGAATGNLTISKIAGAVGAGVRGSAAYAASSTAAKTATLANIVIAAATGSTAQATITESNAERAEFGSLDDGSAVSLAISIAGVAIDLQAAAGILNAVSLAENPSVSSPINVV
jgi:hypothetical protein